MDKIPEIKVGILSAEKIEFILNGKYQSSEGVIDKKWTASIKGKDINLSNNHSKITLKAGDILKPIESHKSNFTIKDVLIGINFHWERKENQSFKGGIQFIIENNKITIVNILSIEDYLLSVISSEMSATSSTELLKAHAVISRSWLLAQIEKQKSLQKHDTEYCTCLQTENEIIKWYDREDHENFHVCADDHCQRYQGITRSTTTAVEEAVKLTSGEVLLYDNTICDARFSKCCGGMVESFENVWEPVKHPYLQKVVDNSENPTNYSLQLKDDVDAQRWINGNPEAFCNTDNKNILQQVLNDYDQETNDFFRWKIEYSQKELSSLIKNKTGFDFGEIYDLIPIKRGDSARIIKLKIIGKKKTLTIGKELEIRKALSKSHLYSSAFIIEKTIKNNETFFVLKGAGWGHGVGLCQIGAAVMSFKGYDYKYILKHYYKNIKIAKIY